MTIPLDETGKLAELLASGAVTASAVIDVALKQIAVTDKNIGAFVTVAEDSAREQARCIDLRRRAGASLGPLAGIPVAVKDVLCTKGLRTTCGSRMLAEFVPPYDATVVASLRKADAVIIGKTNMDEFAMGASTETSAHGPTHNPWKLDCTPGGSSGGAAACVAAGQVPLSIGSDTGGSIRQPAAFCGISGLKPTYGRVSRYGLIAFASSLDQVGPLAWDVPSLAKLLQVLAGHDPLDSTSINAPVPDYSQACRNNVRGLRVGVVHRSQLGDGVDPVVTASLDESVKVLKSCGAVIVDIDLPHAKYWVPTYYVIASSEASSNLSRYEGAHYGFREEVLASEAGSQGPLAATYCRSRELGFGAEVKRRIMLGTYALSSGYYNAYYLKALKVRRLIRNDFNAAFKQVDLLVGPVTPSPAFCLGDKMDDPLQMYLCDLFTVGANLAGLPALSVPAGMAEGLPVGVQFQGPPLAETNLLAIGAAFQRATDWHLRRPRL